MRESLLHNLWEWQKLPFLGLKLTSGEELQVWDPGKPNKNAGPDFLNARIVIGATLWAGHVEMHLRSSHWKVHGHSSDPNYQNVILHVVWEDDAPILGYHGRPIPTLQLKPIVSYETLASVLGLQAQRKDALINCQQDHHIVPKPTKAVWWYTLSQERLQEKSNEISTWLAASRNDWERILFIALLRGFGLHLNSQSFLSLGLKLDYSIVQKLRHDQRQLEALFLGMAGLLDSVEVMDDYTKELRAVFQYQCTKFSLKSTGIIRPDFLRLRPANFPTIRLSQFSVLLSSHPRLFGLLSSQFKRSSLHELLAVSASEYWETHYTFGNLSKTKPKRVSTAFMDVLIINSIIPLQLMYASAMGQDIRHQLRSLLESCPPEQNQILNKLSQLGMRPANALQSQALLQQYEHYCIKNRCLDCAIGRYLLKGI